MGHRRYVPYCKWRNAVAVLMAAVTFGAWIPFANVPSDVRSGESEDESSSVPPPLFEGHQFPTWAEKPVKGNTRHEKAPPPPSSPPASRPPISTPTVSPPTQKPTPKPIVTPVTRPVVPTSKRASLLLFLRAQVGKPYVFGGNGPNVWDCSGLTKVAFGRIGVALPRTSQAQSLVGIRVSTGSLRAGDLLFWGLPGLATHVAVYIGDGKFIAAQNPLVGVVERTVSHDPPSFARRVL